MGRAHLFGDNITTDDIIAGKYKHSIDDVDQLANHVMENIRPGFRALLSPGDFIVAGRNFGCGSSREQAPQILKHCGVQAVLARSVARIFYRNAINIGLRIVLLDTSSVQDGDEIELSEDTERLLVPSRDIDVPTERLEGTIKGIVEAGGLLAFVKNGGVL
ncbi:MAG: 3-isopropylmalate dehydratase [Actinomycetota bacterium]|nr:3-isopropylmalate dehydratase [Actinomycetota bacterium]